MIGLVVGLVIGIWLGFIGCALLSANRPKGEKRLQRGMAQAWGLIANAGDWAHDRDWRAAAERWDREWCHDVAEGHRIAFREARGR